jgi:iron-sulfur cluster assembly protein
MTETVERGLARIEITPEAIAWVKARRQRLGQPTAALRIGVRGGGCNGLTYVTDISDEAPREGEEVFDYDGLAVYLDPRSLKFIEGSTLYVENTLMFQGLRFRNPLEVSRCGCGSTFSVER